MSTTTVKVYWPGAPFAFEHHARKYQIVTGENEVPVVMAQRLKQRFSGDGLVQDPMPTKDAEGKDVPPSAEVVSAVRAAADQRHAAAHRNAGQGPKAGTDGQRPAAALLSREQPGAKVEGFEPAPQPEKPAKTPKPAKKAPKPVSE